MAHLDLFLQRGPQNGDVEASLEELRRIDLTDGIPANTDGTVSIGIDILDHHALPLLTPLTLPRQSDLRPYTWLILLNAPPLNTDAYLDLVRQGLQDPPAERVRREDGVRLGRLDLGVHPDAFGADEEAALQDGGRLRGVDEGGARLVHRHPQTLGRILFLLNSAVMANFIKS